MAEKKINYTAEKINTLLNEIENINSIEIRTTNGTKIGRGSFMRIYKR